MAEWIKITDQIPQKYVKVWGCSAEGRQGFCCNDGHNMKFDHEVLASSIITHWVPYVSMPEPSHDERMFIAQNISVPELIQAEELRIKAMRIRDRLDAQLQNWEKRSQKLL